MDIHKVTKRSTPEMYSKYKCALQCYKVFNERSPQTECSHLKFDTINASRQKFFEITINSKLKIGQNSLCNRLHQ